MDDLQGSNVYVPDHVNIPYTVYENLRLMLGYRNAVVREEKLTEEQFMKKYNTEEFVMIFGDRQGDRIRGDARLTIIMINPNGRYTVRATLRKFLKLVKLAEGTKNEIVLVSESAIEADEMEGAQVESYDYRPFIIEIPRHVLVPEHIISEKSARELEEMERVYRSKSEHQMLPRILSSDPAAVWIGLKPGMVCKIIRPSHTAGMAVSYRFCVKG